MSPNEEKMTLAQRRDDALEKIDILKSAAAQTNSLQALLVAQAPASRDDHTNERVVKFCRYPIRGVARLNLAHDLRDHRPHVDFPRDGRGNEKRIALVNAARGEQFELHGRLTLIIDFMTQAENRRYGVEQPPAG
jgi:hypothetical protein